jgi:hypothetical protein
MQEDKERRIQALLDTRQRLEDAEFSAGDRDDLLAYKTLYSTLKEEPAQGLPLKFKADLLRRIKVEKRRASDLSLYLIVGFVVLIGFAFVGFVVFAYRSVLLSFIDVIVKLAGLTFTGTLAWLLLSLIDRKHTLKH